MKGTEKYIMRSFMFCRLHHNLSVYQIGLKGIRCEGVEWI